jgi:hypothetical protein
MSAVAPESTHTLVVLVSSSCERLKYLPRSSLRLRGDRPDRVACADSAERQRYTVPQFVNGADFVGGGDITVLEGDGFAENVVPW